ncbi:hypothetical protein GDO81_002127 [Engystomops pustulosus]|uniref:Uncharacterized protein n=1 Tax=Engystomops pustulosus TaxID=76066 RepID=A0AAV7DHK3_ENGPU|nr:hypothetical protein GDO81_002127 [Engystomops pustulosus]
MWRLHSVYKCNTSIWGKAWDQLHVFPWKSMQLVPISQCFHNGNASVICDHTLRLRTYRQYLIAEGPTVSLDGTMLGLID